MRTKARGDHYFIIFKRYQSYVSSILIGQKSIFFANHWPKIHFFFANHSRRTASPNERVKQKRAESIFFFSSTIPSERLRSNTKPIKTKFQNENRTDYVVSRRDPLRIAVHTIFGLRNEKTKRGSYIKKKNHPSKTKKNR